MRTRTAARLVRRLRADNGWSDQSAAAQLGQATVLAVARPDFLTNTLFRQVSLGMQVDRLVRLAGLTGLELAELADIVAAPAVTGAGLDAEAGAMDAYFHGAPDQDLVRGLATATVRVHSAAGLDVLDLVGGLTGTDTRPDRDQMESWLVATADQISHDCVEAAAAHTRALPRWIAAGDDMQRDVAITVALRSLADAAAAARVPDGALAAALAVDVRHREDRERLDGQLRHVTGVTEAAALVVRSVAANGLDTERAAVGVISPWLH